MRSCLVPTVLLVALAVALVGCKSKSTASATASEAREMSATAGTNPVHSGAPRLECPPLDPSSASTVSTAKGGHRVILSWKASSRDSKHGTAVGYCLYRATGPKTRATERINILPFAGTKCVDDLVENGKKYYYVVRAISAQGVTSLVSKPAPALIPDSPPSASNGAASAPMCREPESVK